MGHQPAFNERLIEEVKKHPSLYNQTKRSFTDTMERMKMWELIAQEIDPKVSGEFAKKRWLQLRDRYRKELKVAIRQNFSVPQRWCYFSHLSWLDPYLKDNLAIPLSTSDRARSVSVDGTLSSPSSHFPQSILFDSFLKREQPELDDGFDEPHFDDEFLRVNVSSALERVLAATLPQSHQSTHSSTSCTQSTSRDSSPKSDHFHLENTEDGPSMRVNGREVNEGNLGEIGKQLVNSNPSINDWVNDEEMLFARIVGLKLRKMSARQRKRVKSDIITLLDESENEDDDDLLKFTPKSIRLS
ncbi:unnamed protein product, partial [Mesorhabditis belari]|uniref:MADF domain-containing protein n=1 Tax=Mesorhabditis belari TaxID=2138241 RepID=A0AAF3EVI3_9BILA